METRETLGKRLKLRERIGLIFGFLVGVGLLIEYWREIADCIVNRHWPELALIGGILVTLGVFGEVIFSRLVLNTSEELQERADSDVAQALARAAEADLERARLELMLSPRNLTNAQRIELAGKIAPAEVKLLDMFVHGSTPEIVRLSSRIAEALIAGGWHFSSWTVLAREAIAGVIVTVADNADRKTDDSASLLRESLGAFDLDVIDNFRLFDATKDPLIGMVVIPPPNADPIPKSAMRLHIGDKVWDSSKYRPVAPPQA